MNPYKQLLEYYVADLIAAKEYADAWWASLLEAETQRLGDSGSAEASVTRRWPFGPATHPRVVAVYRKYYRACTAITNDLDARAAAKDDEDIAEEREEDWGDVEEDEEKQNEEITTISTAVFMIEYLYDKSDELGEFICSLVFFPIETADEHVLPKDLT